MQVRSRSSRWSHPRDIRRRLNLRPGQRVHVMARGDGVVFVPVVPIDELRGLLHGIDTNV
ncbi:MAG: AbrB/MazE/SpoVT family DNA-binding domain-containing protein [Anaerolineae bacterium]